MLGDPDQIADDFGKNFKANTLTTAGPGGSRTLTGVNVGDDGKKWDDGFVEIFGDRNAGDNELVKKKMMEENIPSYTKAWDKLNVRPKIYQGETDKGTYREPCTGGVR